jgi:DNA-binding Lrp family transcriptional regulator
MSDRYGVTANAIRNRVKNLEEKGVIADYVLRLGFATAGLSPFFALAYSRESLDNKQFVESVGGHRLVSRVGFDSYGSCVIIGAYASAMDLSEFTEFIRGLEEVRDSEIHPIPTRLGGKTELSNLQLRVIKGLRDDPRKPIAKIAQESALTARRVRSTLDQLMERESIRLTIFVDPNAGDSIWLTFRIQWDPSETSASDIREELQIGFPDDFFNEAHSATEPVMWADFLIERVSDSKDITHAIKSIPSARVANTILPFGFKTFPGLMETTLDGLLAEAGLL